MREKDTRDKPMASSFFIVLLLAFSVVFMGAAYIWTTKIQKTITTQAEKQIMSQTYATALKIPRSGMGPVTESVLTFYPERTNIEIVLDVEYAIFGGKDVPIFVSTFEGEYQFKEQSDIENAEVFFPLPGESVSLIRILVDGSEIDPKIKGNDVAITLDTTRSHNITVSYTSRGSEDITYDVPNNVFIEEFNFRLILEGVNVVRNVPPDCLTPSASSPTKAGFGFEWLYSDSILRKDIHVVIPVEQNPFTRLRSLSSYLVIAFLAVSALVYHGFRKLEVQDNELVLRVVLAYVSVWVLIYYFTIYLDVVNAVVLAVAIGLSMLGMLLKNAENPLSREVRTLSAIFLVIPVASTMIPHILAELLSLGMILYSALYISSYLKRVDGLAKAVLAERVEEEEEEEKGEEEEEKDEEEEDGSERKELEIEGALEDIEEQRRAISEERDEVEQKKHELMLERAAIEEEHGKLQEMEERKKAPHLRFCPFCKAEIDQGFSFCPGCGEKIELVRSCKGCGDVILGDGIAYCPLCGSDTRDQGTPRATAQRPRRGRDA